MTTSRDRVWLEGPYEMAVASTYVADPGTEYPAYMEDLSAPPWRRLGDTVEGIVLGKYQERVEIRVPGRQPVSKPRGPQLLEVEADFLEDISHILFDGRRSYGNHAVVFLMDGAGTDKNMLALSDATIDTRGTSAFVTTAIDETDPDKAFVSRPLGHRPE